MASISTDKRGNTLIQFTITGKQRRTLRLGKIGQRTAEKIKMHVEDLAAAKMMRQSVEARTASWVADLDDEMAARLSAVELIEPRVAAPTSTLGGFLDDYVSGRVDVKPATREVWGHTARNLKEHFGEARDVATIHEGDADGFKLYLIGLKTLAPTTISKRLKFTRMFFRAMLRRKLIGSNPFAEVSSKAAGEGDRQFYVSREATERLLAVCNPEWRVIFALARYGGLRTPSETFSLRWQDINWETGRIVVTSPKTEHHEGKATRVIPMFPELRPILAESLETAPDGAEYVLANQRSRSLTAKGWRGCNLRTHAERLIKRAGIAPWPRLFNSLRASRETELAKEYPIHVVTAWMGNTPKIALKHYLMTTDADYERAAKCAAAGACNTVQDVETDDAGNSENTGFADVCNLVHSAASISSGAEGTRTLDI